MVVETGLKWQDDGEPALKVSIMYRVPAVLLFHPLKRPDLEKVLEIELTQVQKRVLDSTTRPFLFLITSKGREFLLQEGTDRRYGARHLKRAIERNVVCPLSRLLATEQVHPGDVLLIDRRRDDEGLVFLRDIEQRSFSPTISFPVPDSGPVMTAQAGI